MTDEELMDLLDSAAVDGGRRPYIWAEPDDVVKPTVTIDGDFDKARLLALLTRS